MEAHETVRWIAALGGWASCFAIAVVAMWQLNSQKRIATQQRELEQRIAERQAKLDEERLRLDLFNRRFAVYVALENLILVTFLKEPLSFEDAVDEFKSKQREAHFLFAHALDTSLDELLVAVFTFHDANRRTGLAGAEHRQWTLDHEVARKAMWAKWDECRPVFDRQMQFGI